ncbi:MAG TPA: phosphate signaling complex protein PhoU [Elusimicrobiota bacterium]|nr:phosphate signaling complex protein PhoU [Elusimicrobiota bacterium]
MQRHFEENLNALKEKIIRMGSLAEEMIQKSVRALMERNPSITQDVFDMEREVNLLHVEVDDRCVKLLALTQPMAVDLRLIAAAMKINTDLERIADQAVNVCQTCYYHLLKETPVPQANIIPRMAEISQSMLKNSLDAFSKKDIELAKKVLLQDEEEDRLKAETLSELIELIKREPDHSKQFVDLILIAKNMERISDHATNIAEDVIFMVLGVDIRHHIEEKRP